MTIRPNRFLAAASVAALLALTGCGGGDDAKKASSTPSASTSTSAGASGSETDNETGTDSGAGGDATGDLADVLSKSMEDGKTAHVTLDMGGQGSGEGDISFDGDAPAMQLDMEISDQKTQMRMVDGTIYIGVPGKPGKFMKMDAGQTGGALGMDPAQALEQLRKSGGKAKDLGDGHWQITQGGIATDLYVGGDGYLEKIEVEGAGAGAITMTYSDWGKDVDVKAPPASDVVAMPGA